MRGDASSKLAKWTRTAVVAACACVLAGWLADPELVRSGREAAAGYFDQGSREHLREFVFPIESASPIPPERDGWLPDLAPLGLLAVGVWALGPRGRAAVRQRSIRAAEAASAWLQSAAGTALRQARGARASAAFLLTLGIALGWLSAPSFVRERRVSLALPSEARRAETPPAALLERFGERFPSPGRKAQEDPLPDVLVLDTVPRALDLVGFDLPGEPDEGMLASAAPRRGRHGTAPRAALGFADGARGAASAAGGSSAETREGEAAATFALFPGSAASRGGRTAVPDVPPPPAGEGSRATVPPDRGAGPAGGGAPGGGSGGDSPRRPAERPLVDLEPVIGQLLVAFEDSVGEGEIAALLDSIAGEVAECFTVVDYCLVRISADLDVAAAAAALRESPLVRDAVPDFRRAALQVSSDSFDPYYPLQWGLSKIQAAKAWAKMGPETNRAKIAVLDTGFDLSHPDLISVYVRTINAVNSGPSQLFPNPVLTGDPDHGTKVAGVLAALGDNFYGIAGANKNWADLVLVQVFEAGLPSPTAKDSDIIRGIQLLPEGVRVANLSFAGPAYDSALCDALSNRSDIVFVAAAGNEGSSTPMYPAACPSSNVLAVAATTRDDRLAGSSSRGSWVDVAAPGEGILTTIPGGLHAATSGTSVAAPHVAGVASLLAARDPRRSAATIASMVASSADPVLGGAIGGGRLNACRALQSLVGGNC